MITIWKLPVLESGPHKMPRGAVFICVHEQDGKPCVWFTCDPKAPLVDRMIYVVGTGWPMKDFGSSKYIGTAFCGSMVWHLLDMGETVKGK